MKTLIKNYKELFPTICGVFNLLQDFNILSEHGFNFPVEQFLTPIPS